MSPADHDMRVELDAVAEPHAGGDDRIGADGDTSSASSAPSSTIAVG